MNNCCSVTVLDRQLIKDIKLYVDFQTILESNNYALATYYTHDIVIQSVKTCCCLFDVQ